MPHNPSSTSLAQRARQRVPHLPFTTCGADKPDHPVWKVVQIKVQGYNNKWSLDFFL